MNVCIIGDSLTSLSLAKNLINKNIKVFVYCDKKNKSQYSSRTIGISKSNFDFFNNEVLKLNNKIAQKIKQIEIYSDNSNGKKILNFKNSKKPLFLMLKNDEIYKILEKNLRKNKLFKKIFIKNNLFYKNINKNKKFDLIINCDYRNIISKIFFYERINKNYYSFAYTTVIKHKKIKNFKATQIFTKNGPIAFLPISNFETSIVFSIKNDKLFLSKVELKKLIQEYNKNYKIKNFGKIEKFNLNFSILRNYYYKDVMMFGDSLHKIHPLAGQGFNMTLRDMKILSNIIQERMDLGLQFDQSIYQEFEAKTKHFNFIFSSGIDFIYEFFKLDNKYKNGYSSKLLKFLGKNKLFNDAVLKYANQGLVI